MEQNILVNATTVNLLLEHLEAIYEQLATLHAKVDTLLERPRFNDYFNSEEEARLMWQMYQIAVMGPDESKHRLFPEDEVRRRIAALSRVTEGYLAKLQLRYEAIQEAEQETSEKKPLPNPVKRQGGVDV